MIGFIHELYDSCLAFKVKSYQRILTKKLLSKSKLKVVFFVLYDSMWKSDRLFEMMMQSNRFDPYIVSITHANQPEETKQSNQKHLKTFFESKGFPFIEGYDFESCRWFDVKSFAPDIIFYQQPYNDTCKEYKVQSLCSTALLCYIPYGIVVENSAFFYNTFFLNVAWKLFYPTSFHVADARKMADNKGRNVVLTGYPLADEIIPNRRVDSVVWKQKDSRIKRVIWAPHHSIGENDMLSYSTFLSISDEMLDLMRSYNGKVQFVFKPHPVLKEKLYKHERWGHERTDKYYTTIDLMPNAVVSESDYVELFNSSDAMIHDCSSFAVEYIYSQKPVMYLSKSLHLEDYNECGKQVLALHYHGHNIDEIRSFIDDVVLGEKDLKMDLRSSFYKEFLVTPNDHSATDNIFNEINISRE